MSLVSEEVVTRANEALISMLDGIEKASEFALEQAPDVIHQLLVWKFTASLLGFVVGVIVFLIPTVIYKALKWHKQSTEDSLLAGVMIAAACVPIGVAVMGFNLTWLQIWIAPKLYLLEYAAELVK